MLSWSGESATLVAPADPPGRIRRWRAEQDGREAAVLQAVMNSPEEAQEAGERLRRLAARPDPTLQAVRGWAVEGNEAWAVTDPEDGSSLATLLRSGALPPAVAAALGWWVLTGLELLHSAGVAHGDLSAETVQIAPNGQVVLRDHLFIGRARAAADETRADVEAAGVVICSALGIPVQGRPGAPLTAAEEAAPALARTVRAIANGASGGNVSGARMALAATAAALVQPEALATAASDLARRIPLGSHTPAPLAPGASSGAIPIAPASRPALTPPELPPRRYVATASDFESLREPFDWRRLLLPIAVLAGLAVVLLIGLAVVPRLLTSGGAPTSVAGKTPSPVASKAPTPAPHTPTPTPKPSGPPSFGPAASGDVKSVAIAANGGCAVGGSCAVEVTVKTTTAGAPNDVTWTIKTYDACTGAVADVGTDKVTEQNGWNTVIGDRTVTLPAARGQLQVLAVTSAPATAASPPLTVGSGSC
ncbi:MAG TPA: hypothetical protein VF160_08335 [Candidatus Dormibacteraeota bacterium]